MAPGAPADRLSTAAALPTNKSRFQDPHPFGRPLVKEDGFWGFDSVTLAPRTKNSQEDQPLQVKITVSNSERASHGFFGQETYQLLSFGLIIADFKLPAAWAFHERMAPPAMGL
ncbi:hypothetical protein IFM61392_10337 [Aspergillus lentulus]|nr:hypothetical protein IFM47457_11123 [Aspergillus lentulus]GFG18012.1 hypothetical protein IFM61392_10337 [Aspergillus lentulus]